MDQRWGQSLAQDGGGPGSRDGGYDFNGEVGVWVGGRLGDVSAYCMEAGAGRLEGRGMEKICPLARTRSV
jgi:hypothetical protein